MVILATSSSAGLAASQLTNLVGATPVAPSRTGSKRQALVDAEAAHIIATEEEGLVVAVTKLTDGKGARVVFDPVGGPTLVKLAAATAERGIVFEYGALRSEPTPLPLFDVLGRSLTIRGYLLNEITTDAQRLEKTKAFIVDGLATGKLKPAIARLFPFEEIVEAHRYLESNQQIGKIVVTVWDCLRHTIAAT